MDRRDVEDRLKALLEEREEVAFALLFGSILEEGSFGDVDLAVYISTSLEPLEELKYKLHFEVEGERALGVPLDVKILNTAPYTFAFRVLKEGKPLLIREEEVYINFIERTSLRYMDEGYLWKKSLEELEAAFADR